MDEKDFADFDEEEFEMLINGLIHPQELFTPPDMLAGAYPAPVGGMGGPTMPGMPTAAGNGFGGPFDDMIAQAYDEEE